MFGGLALGQEFSVTTPKGELLVNVRSNKLELGSFFQMEGTVTNNTDWDLSFVTLRVTFFDASGSEMASLCPREPDGAYCEVRGFDAPAHKTSTLPSGPGVVLSMKAMGYSGRNPPIANYKLTFKDAAYYVRYRFAMVKPIPNESMVFEDAQMAFVFVVQPKGIACGIKNKTTDPVTINWNNVSYIDADSEAHKVIHAGVRYQDKAAPQPPTVVPPLAKITETLLPADHITSSSSGWSEKPLWKDFAHLSEDLSVLKRHIGSTFALFLPIEVEGKTKNYTFLFKITDVAF